jgi:CRP-like cAMP-binding protein
MSEARPDQSEQSLVRILNNQYRNCFASTERRMQVSQLLEHGNHPKSIGEIWEVLVRQGDPAARNRAIPLFRWLLSGEIVITKEMSEPIIACMNRLCQGEHFSEITRACDHIEGFIGRRSWAECIDQAVIRRQMSAVKYLVSLFDRLDPDTKIIRPHLLLFSRDVELEYLLAMKPIYRDFRKTIDDHMPLSLVVHFHQVRAITDD